MEGLHMLQTTHWFGVGLVAWTDVLPNTACRMGAPGARHATESTFVFNATCEDIPAMLV